MKNTVILIGLAAMLLGSQGSQAAIPAATTQASNPEMKQIYDADQSDRSGEIGKIDWDKVHPRDADRREKTRALLAAGQLHTGDDFVEAAFVFQHGSGDDFLLAHTLAVVATKKGASGGPWIAAATLDRYLQSHGHKQIYGTQTSFGAGMVSKEPYDRNLISDALRGELGVKDLATQDAELAQNQAKNGASTPSSTPTSAPTAAQQPAVRVEIKCQTGPIERVFVRATWNISSCDNGALIAVGSGQPPALIFVSVLGGKVIVTRQGGTDEAEIKVAQAAFQAMTPEQVADIIAQTKPH